MKRKGLMIALISTLSMMAMPIMAQSTTEIIGGIKLMKVEQRFEDPDSLETPRIKITIVDAYKRAGKTEKIAVQLQNATWSDGTGTSLQFREKKNLESNDIAIRSDGESLVQLYVDIPDDLKEGEAVSFELPLLIRALSDEVSVQIKPGEEAQLITEKTLLIGSKSDKKLSWEIGEVPELIKEGEIAPLTFTELRPYAVAGNEIEVTLELTNSNLAFGPLEYTEKKVHADDTDYILDAEEYTVYEGGLSGKNSTLRAKIDNDNDKKITFRFSGDSTSETGSITFKHIPIINKVKNFREEDVKLKISGSAITDTDTEAVVGRIVEKTTEQKEVEEAKKQAEEEKKQKEQEEAERKIIFTIGEDQYITGNKSYKMDGAAYIQAPGYTMVPIKYVAVALGIQEDQIDYISGSIWVRTPSRAIQLILGNKIAYVNNSPIPMATEPVLKEGRSYIPMAELARLLGKKYTWDASNKQVTFYK